MCSCTCTFKSNWLCLCSSGIRAHHKTQLHPVSLQTGCHIGKSATPRRRGCNPKLTQAPPAEKDWSDSSACECASHPITAPQREILLWKQIVRLKQKQCYHCTLKMTFTSEQSSGQASQSVPLYFSLVSNHEDEDNLPEALAAISSQSTGKSGSTSSLDKQIQPSIYPQVTCTLSHMQTHLKRPQRMFVQCTTLMWL